MTSAATRAGIIAGAMLLATFPLAAQNAWEPLNTGTTQDLQAVHFVNADVGYAAGAAGTVVKTTDGGATWTDVSLSLGLDIQDLYFFDESTGLVVGPQGRIGRTEDGGATWALVPSGTSKTLYSVSFSGPVGIIGAESQGILRSDDQGRTWAVVQSGFVGFPFFGAYMRSPTDGYVAGQNAIFQPNVGFSDDGGRTWDYVVFYFNGNEGRNRDVYFLDALDGLTVGETFTAEGAISRTADGGQNWSTTLFPDALNAVDFGTEQAGYSVGANGAILATADGGQTWTPEPSGTAATLYDVSIPTASTAYAAGGGGTVLKRQLMPITPLTLTVLPIGPPITVAPGGSFQYTAQVSNTGNVALTFDLWAEATHGGSGLSVTQGPRTITLPAGASRQVTVTQRVSRRAPGGVYAYTVNAGLFPGTVLASDGFSVTVDGSEAAPRQGGADTWEVTFDVAEARGATTPSHALEPSYPNPFRAQTAIRYSLPEGAHVTLRVYDALGQEVAVLVDGPQPAGRHDVIFDASRLSAGMYFYRLEAGAHTSTRSMLRVK